MAAWVVLALLAQVTAALAHAFSISGLTLELRGGEGEQRLELDLPTLDTLLVLDVDADGRLAAAEIEAARPRVLAYLAQHVALSGRGGSCSHAAPHEYRRIEDRLRVMQRVSCPAPVAALVLVNDAFQEDEGGHTFLGSFRVDGVAESHTFRGGATRARFAATASAPLPSATLLANVVHGMLHIWKGLDHVLFVVSVVLAAGGLRELVWVISAFTLAHSVTLSLGALGVLSPPAEIVEPAIALSIVLVALENLWLSWRRRAAQAVPPNGRHWRRAAVVFVFGLGHGFGFSGELRELGLGPQELARALVGFNLGVEVGQLLVVLPLYLLLRWLSRTAGLHRTVVIGVSGLVLVLSSLWFIQRLPGADAAAASPS
ncbi:MAG TPA: HupE/UreJ family protein [Polyangiales bacterium]